MRSGCWQKFVAPARRSHDCVAACVLCYLCRHLERPRIDEEAALVWLTEMSQPALNVTMREIHLQLRALGEDLYDAGRRLDSSPENRRQKEFNSRDAEVRRPADRRSVEWLGRRGGRRLRACWRVGDGGRGGDGSGCWRAGRRAVCGRTKRAARPEPLWG